MTIALPERINFSRRYDELAGAAECFRRPWSRLVVTPTDLKTANVMNSVILRRAAINAFSKGTALAPEHSPVEWEAGNGNAASGASNTFMPDLPGRCHGDEASIAGARSRFKAFGGDRNKTNSCLTFGRHNPAIRRGDRTDGITTARG